MARALCIIFLCLVFLCSFNRAHSSTPCSGPLPEYLGKSKDYYPDVVFKQDDCHPSFAFSSPSSYSGFGLKYSNYAFYFPYPETMEGFDLELRKQISGFEDLFSVQEYYNLISQDDDLLEARRNLVISESFARDLRDGKEGKDAIMNIVKGELENRKVVKPFLAGRKWGDYSGCRYLDVRSAGFGRDNDGTLKMISIEGLTCNGTEKINLRLNIENNEVKEAYIFGQDSSSYKKVYP